MKRIIEMLALFILLGIFLNFLSFLCTVILYMCLPDKVFTILLVSILLVAAITVGILIIYRCGTIGTAIIRAISVLTSYVVVYVLNGHFRVRRTAYGYLNVYFQSATENVSGMLDFSFILMLLFTCFISMIIVVLSKLYSASKKR